MARLNLKFSIEKVTSFNKIKILVKLLLSLSLYKLKKEGEGSQQKDKLLMMNKLLLMKLLCNSQLKSKKWRKHKLRKVFMKSQRSKLLK